MHDSLTRSTAVPTLPTAGPTAGPARTIPRARAVRRAMPLLLTGIFAIAVGCDSEGPDAVANASAANASAANASAPNVAAANASAASPVVDSIFPVEEEIRRFRETLEEAPDTLRRGSESRDELVLRVVRAIETADTAALAAMTLDRAEFAWLYYPHSRYTKRPYRLSPALAWYQLQNRSSQGLTRLLRRYAGVEMGYIGYECPDEPEMEEENRYWHGCVIIHADPAADPAAAEGAAEASGAEAEPIRIRLFGSIMERDGRYKLAGFSNGL